MNGGLCTKEGWQQVMSWKPGKEKVTRRVHPQKIRTGRLWIGKFEGEWPSRAKARKGRAGEMRILDKRLTENQVKTNTSIHAIKNEKQTVPLDHRIL